MNISSFHLLVNFILELDPLNLEFPLLEYAPVKANPIAVPFFGLLVSFVCGYTFWKLIKKRIDDFVANQTSIFPLSSYQILISYTGLFAGLSIFFAGSVNAFGFSYESAFFSSSLIALVSSSIIWNQLSSLLQEIEKGDVKEIDQFF